MGIVSGGGGGGAAFNGGTITNPLIIDCSGKADDVQALRVKYPETLDFSTKPFQFEVVNQFDLFAFLTTGRVSSQNNGLTTAGGNLDTAGGTTTTRNLAVNDAGSNAVLNASGSSDQLSFFSTALASQQTLVPGTCTPEQIATALATYGLTKAS